MKITAGVLLFLFTGISSLCLAETIDIIAIKSQDTIPYNTTLREFKDYLNRQHIEVRITEIALRDKSQDELLNISKVIKSISPNLILALGTPAARLAQESAKNILVLCTMVLDPEASKIEPPGISIDIPIQIKLRQLKRLLPDAKKIGLFYSPSTSNKCDEASLISGRFGLEVVARKINSAKELPNAFKGLWRQIDCFLIIPDSKIYSAKSVEYILIEAFRKKIPVIGLSSSYTKAGALISFECNYENLGKQTAETALNMLNGKDPASIGFLGPKEIDFSLNILAAKRLDIKLLPEIIKEAREVFGE
jgi:putative ABC transport system substrate-binding protein